jgi:putative flippase GtrA
MIRPYYHRPYLLRLYQQGEIGLIVQYLTAGFIVTCVDYGSFVLFFNILAMGLFVATVVGYVGGLIISYLLNRYWVFKKNSGEQSTKSAIFRYSLLLFINLLITYGMLWAMDWQVCCRFLYDFLDIRGR